MNIDYKLKDILNEFNVINSKSRKRELVDKRSYLIALMYFKFGLVEEQIATLTNITRAKVQYNKYLPGKYGTQLEYSHNTDEFKKKYPFSFPEFRIKRPTRDGEFVKVRFSIIQREKLISAKKELGHTDVSVTIKYLIKQALKERLWDI